MFNTFGFNSIIDLLEVFKDEQTCTTYLEYMRWEDCIESPFDKTSKIYFCAGNKYKCKNTGKYFNVRTGTMFDNSKIPLQKWFLAIWMVTIHSKGISSVQLSKDIHVTQKSAWFMIKRIHNCFGFDNDHELDNEVEIDETYVGGKNKNRHKDKKIPNAGGRSTVDKAAVIGMVERGGKVKARKITDAQKDTLTKEIVADIKKTATLYTDEWMGYNGVNQLYEHFIVNHGSGEYVNGKAHTNTIEGFWSILKRVIFGIHHSVSKKHLQLYIDSVTFRYNNRNLPIQEKMNLLLANSNKRLKYKEIIAWKNPPLK